MSVCSDGVSCSRLAPPGFCFSSQADDGSRMLRFCPVLLVLMLPACGASVVIQRDAQFDVTYDDTVTSDNQTIYSYNHTVSRNKARALHNTDRCRDIWDAHTNPVCVCVCVCVCLSDGGRACVRGAAVRERSESGSVRGPAEAGRAVLPGSPHPQRPVSTSHNNLIRTSESSSVSKHINQI